MASVLGKRSRDADACTPLGARSKRASRRIEVHNDENSPTLSIPPVSITKDTVKELVTFKISTPSKKRATGRPAKHGKPTSRVSPAAKKINAHFGVSKSSVEPLQKVKTHAASPSTPRHRDVVLSDKPTTPANRVRVPGSVLTPKTPATPCTTSKASPYAQARQLFAGCSDQSLLVGRVDERKQVSDFITTHLESGTGGCLYISGPPGTGKSAFVGDIIQRTTSKNASTVATLNCMSIKSSTDLMQNLVAEFSRSTCGHVCIDALKTQLTTRTRDGVTLLVLDEIDRLVDLDIDLLYSLFEWSMQPASSFVLIGIANALDLTDRLLPRLKSRRLKPALLPFMPYTAPQISDIITTKLQSLNISGSDPNYIPFLQPAAILLCSKKVASQTGDLRKAFDIIKRALSLAESDARGASRLSPSKSPVRTPLSENINLSSPPITTPVQTKLVSSLSHLTPETAPRATIAHVAKVTSQIFSNGTSARLGQLSIQQKAVLCSLVAFEKRARSSISNTLSSMTQFVPPTPSKTGRGKVDSPSTKQLYDSYSELCKRDNLLHALSSVEFKDVLSGLETLSLIEFVDGKGKGSLGLMTPTRTPSRKSKKNDFGQMSLGVIGAGEERKVSSAVGFNELRDSIGGAGSQILMEILEG